jgi:hypothetical protein
MELGPQHALFRGLRRAGGEAQLTQALESLFQADPGFASAFLKLVVDSAPHHDRLADRAIPDELLCRAEEAVTEGRVDLSFTDEGTQWRAFVELKIHAPYGSRQIERYLESVRGEAPALVVAITRDDPTYGEDSEDARWAGSVRWGTILDRLRKLRPADDSLAQQWPLFLDVLETEGSMGMTQPDPEMLLVWAKGPPARAQAESFVEAVRRPLLDVLRRELVGAGLANDPESAAASVLRGKTKKRAVFPRLGKMQAEFRVPADGRPVISAGLWGWGDLNFVVEIPYPRSDVDPERARTIARRLQQAGFRSWRDRLLENFLPLDENALRDPALQDTLIEFARASFGAVVSSGFLTLGDHVQLPEDVEEESAET